MTISQLTLSFLLVGLGSAHPQYPSDGGNNDEVTTTESPCPAYTHDCVPYYQCIDGVINTSGIGVIDIRSRNQTIPSNCVNPEYPGVPALCCQIPGATAPTSGPTESCPSGLECLEAAQCNADGTANTDGSGNIDQCYIPGTSNVGVCCQPPPSDSCSGNQVCLPQGYCNGSSSAEGAATYNHTCFVDKEKYVVGKCCDSPYKPADQCGIRNHGIQVNQNEEAQFGEFPWQAMIFFTNTTFKCGASLVADRWLVTGAHCVHGYTYGDFNVRLGEWHVDTSDEPKPHIDVGIAAIHVHPKYNRSNLWNDVAVIELTAHVTPEYHINTVCLPTPNQLPYTGTRCFATGWGKDAFEGTYQAILKKVEVPYVEKSYCQDLLRQTRLGKYFQLDESFICAGGEENQDACTGDGGGPLVCQDPNTNNYFLQGITAWGINCGQLNVPGVYVDVQYFADWISNIIFEAPVTEVTQSSNIHYEAK